MRVTPNALHPRLRHLEVHPIDRDGQRGLLLRDPLGIAGASFIPEVLVPVLAALDGRRTIDELQLQVERGSLDVPKDFVRTLVRQLDERGLLESDAFDLRLSNAVRQFLAETVRPARHAGSAGYPKEPEALRAALREIVPSSPLLRAAPRGLIAPHIDLSRGER